MGGNKCIKKIIEKKKKGNNKKKCFSKAANEFWKFNFLVME